MSSSSEKRQISITVDAQLLDEIDKLSNQATGQNASDRSLVFEEALRLWRSQKIEAQLQQFYQNRNPLDIEDESDWAEMTQADAIATWNEAAS
jgi:hypothetical protein